MKELSIEEKAKRYDEALRKAKEALDSLGDNYICRHLTKDDVREMYANFFPELKESEDERIRKEIEFFIAVNHKDDAEKAHWLYWLKKQGQDGKVWFYRDDYVRDKKQAYQDGIDNVLNNPQKYGLEKQGEQNPTDKIEPKFKNGQWIVWQDKCYKVNYNGCGYELVDQNGLSTSLEYGTIDGNAHLWTIQDAKDGDVLFTSSTASHETFIFKNIDEKGNAKCYFAYDSEDGFREGKYHFIGRATNCKPATKEQRDLLLQKMHEAGYLWNSKNKQLLCLKAEPDKVQPAEWSKEDETMITLLHNIIDHHYSMDIIKKEEQLKLEDWLKSLKNRVQPLPAEWSEEDEAGLGDALWAIKQARTIAKDENDMGNLWYAEDWLKSLRHKTTWKPADGDDLPEIDREVIALLNNGKVVFTHRPPEFWDGKNIVTGKVTRNYPKTYDKGGWNIPDVKYWLDVDLPKQED